MRGIHGNALCQTSYSKMYKLDVRVDTKEAAAIERRRSLEQQRQARIFNAKERTVGVR